MKRAGLKRRSIGSSSASLRGGLRIVGKTVRVNVRPAIHRAAQSRRIHDATTFGVAPRCAIGHRGRDRRPRRRVASTWEARVISRRLRVDWRRLRNRHPHGSTRLHPSASPLLSVRNVSVRFGGIVALDGVTFDVFPGQIAGLIGPNGAGKTTLFNCLSRLYTPNGGDVLFEGKSILDRPRYDIPHIGIGRTFQNVALFDRMSVLDNVKVGCHSRSSTELLRQRASACPRSQRGGARIAERADELIAVHGPRAVHARARRPAAVPDPQARRARARARLEPQAAAARRAGGRPQPRGDRDAEGPDQARARHCSTSPCCWSSIT